MATAQPVSRPAERGRRSARRSASAAIATRELQQRLGDTGTRVVDVRPLAAFNGWRLEGERRGGHVPGAVSLPAAWSARLDHADLAELLAAKGLDPATELVLYGYRPAEVEPLAARLRALGYAVSVFAAGWAAWAADASLPVEKLARHERLVYPDWLQQLLAGGRPEAAPQGRFLLFHVNFGVPEEYAEAHLPGALYLDTNTLESAHDWNRRSPKELEAALRAHGITRDTTVILYGRDTEGHANEKWPGRRAGQIAATRAALILHYCGLTDVRLLDGGYDAWALAGYQLETSPRLPTPVPSSGLDLPERPQVIVDLEEAKGILANRDGAALVSVRTWSEHIGAVSGYNYIRPAGRIPGDVWGNCGTDAYHMQHYRNLDNTMRPYPEIAANWQTAGITPDKHVAFYCGTGWRASETWFYASLMDWPQIAVYDGGWLEWSNNPHNPIETGQPTDQHTTPAHPAPVPLQAAS